MLATYAEANLCPCASLRPVNSAFRAADPEWRACACKERGYDREIEPKVKVLMQMQKAGAAAEPPRRPPVTGKYMKKRQIPARSNANPRHGEITSKPLNVKEIYKKPLSRGLAVNS